MVIKTIFIFSITFIVLFHATYSQKVCRAVALGGGGDRGAYEAGAVWGLFDKDSSIVNWDVVAGISAGSINSASIAMFPKGQEKQANDFLLKRWRNIKRSDVYKDWPGGLPAGFLLHSGLWDTTPLHGYLTHNINSTNIKSSGRKLLMGASCLSKATYQLFDENDPELVLAVMSSSAVPGVFPVVMKGGEGYVDGGLTYLTPVTDAITKCKTISNNVTIDVILAIGLTLQPHDVSKIKTYEVLFRSFEEVIRNIFEKDILNAHEAYPDVKIRLIQPSKWLPGWFLGFEYSEEMIQIGYKDALNSNYLF